MTARECREAVAAALRSSGVLPAGWVVYAKPPMTATVPSVVVGPRSPYRVMETFTEERVGLRVSVLMPAGADLDDMDAVLDDIVPVIWDIETVGIDQVTDVGLVTEADSGPSYLSAAIDLWVI